MSPGSSRLLRNGRLLELDGGVGGSRHSDDNCEHEEELLQRVEALRERSGLIFDQPR